MAVEPALARSPGLVAALVLIGVTALIVVGGVARDALERRSGPEGVVRSYFQGLELLDADRSVEQIVPEARERLTPFIENGAGNRYQIVGIAAEEPSILARLAGAPGDPTAVTIFLDITQTDGLRWQAGPRVPLIRRDGRWYLGDAPLRLAGG